MINEHLISMVYSSKRNERQQENTLLTDHRYKGFTIQKQPNIDKVLPNESCKSILVDEKKGEFWKIYIKQKYHSEQS